MIKSISVLELKELIDEKGIDGLQVIDCREADEFGYCHLEGTKNVPISVFEDRDRKSVV